MVVGKKYYNGRVEDCQLISNMHIDLVIEIMRH